MASGLSRMGGARERIERMTSVLAAMLCLTFVFNVLWFTVVASIPLPASDAWHFLEVFVAPAVDGSLTLTHFFDQRSADDHAQPLQKLVLWLHLNFAQLDFGLEALVGVLFAVVTVAILGTLLLRDIRHEASPRRAYHLLGVCALFAIALSLNSTNLYTWSLVTLGWVLVLVPVVYWLGLSMIKRTTRLALYALAASFTMALVLDELAFPVLIAATIAVAVRDGLRNPRCAAVVALAGALGLAIGRLSLEALSPGASVPAGGASSAVQALEAMQSREAWRLLVGPLSDSLVHRLHLQHLEPGTAELVQWVLAVVLGTAHLGFWWRALASRRLPSSQVTVVAVALMLLFYATIAGIALSRVSMFGMDYVHQPRYVIMYQLNIIALLLMFFAPQDRTVKADAARTPVFAVAAVGAFLLVALQLPLSFAAWDSARYLSAYVQRSDENLRQLALDPSALPAGGCTDILTICEEPAARRHELTALLQENQLNLYSAAFRARHGLEPLQNEAQLRESRGMSAGACSNAVLAWGPRSIVPGQPFYPQPDGRSAYWVELHPALEDFTLSIEGRPVAFDRQGQTISFLHDPAWTTDIEADAVLTFEIRCAQGEVSAFQVQVQKPEAG